MLNYTDVGHGKVVIFIHGFCENLKIWKAFEDEISKFMRVICIDLPGFGESRFLESSITIEWFADQVLDLSEGLKIKNFSLVGHSLGGYVSLAIAEKHNSSIDSLVLFHSSAFADTEIKKESRDRAADFISRNGLDKYMDSFVEPLFAEVNRAKCKDSIEFLKNEGKKCDQKAVMQTIIAMKERKERLSVLANFSKPVLLLIGEDDIAIPLVDSQKLSELNSNIQSLFLKNCGHMGMFEKPHTCLTRLKEFYFS